MTRYARSQQFLEQALAWTPTASQTLSKAPERFPMGAFPVFADHGKGATLWDIDGNQFVDFICGLACMTLGYRHPHVEEAIASQLRKGTIFSLPSLLESQVAERVCHTFPCARQDGSIRWVKTGSEANEGALRIARRATGRKIVVTVGTGYHSWHAWAAAYKPWHPGVPDEYVSLVRTFCYNDLGSLDRVLDAEVALVILEPSCHELTTTEFLQGVVDRAHAVGALVCFDEVVCANRWARGGGQEFFGVVPDFATAGKSLANGMPLGCIVGPRTLLQYADLVSGTFGGEALSLSACNAVLDVYEEEPVIQAMWWRGQQLQDYVNARAIHYDVPAVCDGYPCKPRIRFLDAAFPVKQTDGQFGKRIENKDKMMSLFLQETAAAGVLFHPGGFNVCAALTDADMEVTFRAVDAGLYAVSVALKTGDWSALQGKLCQPVVTVRS